MCSVHLKLSQVASRKRGSGFVLLETELEDVKGCIWERMHACVRARHFSRVRLFGTPWTVARQPPLSMGFSRQEYWGGLLCPPLEDLSNPGIEPTSPMSPESSGGFSTGPWEWVLSVRLRPRR